MIRLDCLICLCGQWSPTAAPRYHNTQATSAGVSTLAFIFISIQRFAVVWKFLRPRIIGWGIRFNAYIFFQLRLNKVVVAARYM